jgi:regulator of protease activity HflC (stomatin/prohibitin superfamily)
MALIILGVIALIVSFVIAKSPPPLPRFAGVLRGIAIVIIVMGVLISCIKQIDAGQVGVKSLFGKVQNDVLVSGLNIINPLVDVYEIDINPKLYYEWYK